MQKNKNKLYVFFIVIVAVFVVLAFPKAITKPSQGLSSNVVIGVGVDKIDSGFEVSLQIIIPDTSQSNNEKSSIVSETGETIVQALNNLSYKLGKSIGFEHAGVLVIGKSMHGQDMVPVLDYFYRSGKMSLNAALFEHEGSAKAMLVKATQLNNTSSGNLQTNQQFNENFFGSSKSSTIGIFYNQYFKKGGGAIVALIKEAIEEEESSSGGANSSESQGSGSGSSGSGGSGDSESGGEQSGGKQSGGEQSGNEENSSKQSKKQAQEGGAESEASCSGKENTDAISPNTQYSLLNNEGGSAVYKKGKFVALADSSLNRGFNWFDPKVKIGVIKVENLDAEPFENAIMSILVKNSSLSFKYKIANNKLILKANIKLYCQPLEIKQNKQTKLISKALGDYLTDEVKAKAKIAVAKDIEQSFIFCKEHNVDAFNIEDMFYKHKNKEYKKFMQDKTSDVILDFAEIIVDVNVYEYK